MAHTCVRVHLQNGELSSLEEYFNEEDPLDYTPEYNDIAVPGNLYADERKGMLLMALNSDAVCVSCIWGACPSLT